MEFLNNEELSPPPGIILSLKSGFDITANHIKIILFPVLLDLFLWLGPRLDLKNSFRTALIKFNMASLEGFISEANAQSFEEFLSGLSSQAINLFALLRTFPIGVSSIMRLVQPASSPLGEPTLYEVDSTFVFFLWTIALTFIGWVLGSLYFTSVAKATLQDEKKDFLWAGKAILQTTLLAIFWLIIFLTFGIPLVFIYAIFALINATLAKIAFFFLVIWLIVPIFFSVHGIFTKGEHLLRSIWSSFHLSRYTLPTSSFFIICIIVLSYGFNILWLTPSPSSWMMLVGILGHAFITTSLLSASFIYYRDMQIWLEAVLEIMNSKKTSAQTEKVGVKRENK